MKRNLKILIKLVVFSVVRGKLWFFLRNKSLPEAPLKPAESLDKQASFLFRETFKVPLSKNYLEQLYTFSGEKGIVIAYFILLPSYEAPEVVKKLFVSINNLSLKTADAHIVTYAVQRLRWKIEYTNVVYSLLPPEFTFHELQTTYEAILGRILDKRNFRKKILSLGILKDTGHRKSLGKARPAEMFAFKKRKLTYVEVL